MKLPGLSRWLPQDHYSFVATSLLLVALALSSWFISRHWIELRIQNQLQELKLQSTQVAATTLEGLQQDRRQTGEIAQSLSSLSSLRLFLKNSRNSTALQADMDQFGSIFDLAGIWLLDRRGKVLAQSTASPSPPDFNRYTDGNRPLSRLIFDPEQQQARIYHATPVTKNGSVTLLICANATPVSLSAYRLELLVTDANGIIVLANNPDWLRHSLGKEPIVTTESELPPSPLPTRISPLHSEVLLLGSERQPVLLVSYASENEYYQVHALADAESIYRQTRDKDNLAAIITLAGTGSFWGGLLTILTLKRNRRHGLAISRANNELLRLNQQLKQQATTDALTQCPNRRAAEALMRYELANLQRYHHPFCIVMIDIDHFKHVNDQHGHDIGDKVLRHFAVTGRKAIRDTDVLARIGGEEFLLILPQTQHQQAMQLAQRLLDSIAQTPLYLADRTIGFTFSGGLTEATPEDDISQLLIRADQCLYQAKETGRCRICCDTALAVTSAAAG
ncbi:sensor domain-containing diguanylate cyclase [uncultured Oceanisphaera sp.]|uniref:GGDEF domain-containing protein n=1 Tax=uncultured Oceanisphaera sp. TaxID=353858 RepID=UPI0026017EF2|nr:sensor domain-containing diguanylate cyclase [uncultured Oceanisphaera sp.]